MQYTGWSHLYLTIVGAVLLIVLLFTMRPEISYLLQHREQRLQFVLSLTSVFIMLILTMVTLFHWILDATVTFVIIMALFPLLLILAPMVLGLRAKSFASLTKSRIEEQRKLIREVQDLIDEKKRERIKEGKVARGEELEMPGSAEHEGSKEH